MNSTSAPRVLSLDEAAALGAQQLVDLVGSLSREVEALKQQIDWFKRQISGQKSEKRILVGGGGQMSLGEIIDQGEAALPPERPVAAYTRRAAANKPEAVEESAPFFDESRVPVEVIELAAPEAERLAAEDFEVIGHKESYRLAQRPGSYVVLKYRRPVIKIKQGCFRISCV